jgi:class 3 adenylate cyclase/tetratricopeptide (TPR) repeat protein
VGIGRDSGIDVHELIRRAEDAITGARWLEALDLAAQALAADPLQPRAAALVGTARQRLGTASSAGAELRQVTVLAIDMVSSTTIAARLGPELMRELMLATYELCAEAVARYEGRVVKYSGDGVLAQFGHPIAHEDDARRGVLGALAVIEQVQARSSDWERQFGQQVKIRVGIDSGLAAVGPVDATPWSLEEIAGDPPNVATRVQATAAPMTVRITDATAQLIEGWFETAPAGIAELRNYPRPVGLHVVLRPTRADTRLEARVRPRPKLVGRDRELAVLRSVWNEVSASGERKIVGIVGEAGIGKSRLAEHMVATAAAAGGVHLTLACSTLYRDSPLRPVARALARFFRVFPHEGGTDEAWLDALRNRLEALLDSGDAAARSAPILGRLLGIHTSVDLEPADLRRRTFDVLIELFEAMASGPALLVCVEDADSADPSTLELLTELLRRPPTRTLVLLTGRTLAPGRTSPDELLELKGLADDQTAALARSVDSALDELAVARIVERADGVPFFAEELARAAREAPGGSLTESIELSAFLAARLDELDGNLKRVLRPVAVADQELPLGIVGRLSDLSPASLTEAVSELERRRVLVRRTGPAGDSVRFRHSLMRAVAYESILESRRTTLHGTLAALLADLPTDAVAPEDVASHFELAGDPGRAAPQWLEAARRAAAGGSNAEAAELFRRALSVIERLPASPDRASLELQVQHGLGAVLSRVEGYTSPAARTAYERAAELARDSEQSTALVLALYGVWEYWIVLGEHRRASELAERCIEIARAEWAPERSELLAAAISGYEQLYLGNFRRARDELDVAGRGLEVELTEVISHESAVVSLSTLPVATWFLGEAERARSLAAAARAAADALDPNGRRTAFTQAYVGCLLAWHSELDGAPDAALEFADRAIALATERGYATWGAAGMLHRSIALCSLRRYEEGLPVLSAMVEAWRSAGRDADGTQRHPVLMTPYFAGRLAEALLATGDAARSRALVDQTLAGTALNGERFWDVELLRLRAELRALAGEPEEQIAADLDAARRLGAEQGAASLALRMQPVEPTPKESVS